MNASDDAAAAAAGESLAPLQHLVDARSEATGHRVPELAHFRALVESSEDAVISKTLAGVVTSWNRGAQALFGYSAAEMLGRPMLALFPPERVEEEVFILEKILEGEKVSHFETVRLHKDGHRIEVSVSISPIRDSHGRVVGASKIARDITAQKAAAQQQRLAASVFTNTAKALPLPTAAPAWSR